MLILVRHTPTNPLRACVILFLDAWGDPSLLFCILVVHNQILEGSTLI